jgi:hypothetical protein
MPNPSAPAPLEPPTQPGANPTRERPDTPARDEPPKGAPPKDPGVYGGQWGDGPSTPGLPPTDRPGRIKPPAEKE